jgi:hypothetical protein
MSQLDLERGRDPFTAVIEVAELPGDPAGEVAQSGVALGAQGKQTSGPLRERRLASDRDDIRGRPDHRPGVARR